MTDEQYYTLENNQLISVTATGAFTRIIILPICPDLLDYEMIGVADNLRGRVVRAFFWLMRIWPV